jgi:hypothetical protein
MAQETDNGLQLRAIWKVVTEVASRTEKRDGWMAIFSVLGVVHNLCINSTRGNVTVTTPPPRVLKSHGCYVMSVHV